MPDDCILLTAAPNPYSKGVLMFKKRQQRAKKYTLVSFGAAAGTGAEEEDGLPPTGESELDKEAFSDACSLTNQSDWDSPYLDMELARPSSGTAEGRGLGGQPSEASRRGAQLFEQQCQRAASITQQLAQEGPAATLNRQGLQSPPQPQSAPPEAALLPSSPLPAPVVSPRPFLSSCGTSTSAPSIFNRSASTPGLQGLRSGTTLVIFRPLVPKRANESLGGLSTAPPPFLSPPQGTFPVPSFT